MASKAAKKAQQIEQDNYNRQTADNQNWYDRNYNADATQRADTQRILNKTQDYLRRSNRAAQAAAAVGGLSEESVAAQKQANANAMADATSQIAVANEARKENIDNIYNERKNALGNAHAQFGVATENNRANNITQAAVGAAEAMGNAGIAGDEFIDAKLLGKK